MKRAAGLLAVLVVVICALAQTSRDAYRAAYREWREADPALERDASAPATDLAARAAKVAAGAAQYGSARAAFLHQWAEDERPKLAWLETPPEAPSAMIVESASTLIAAENRALRRMMDTYATDPDRGIRDLRTVLTRESAAVDALIAALDKRKLAADAVKAATAIAADSQLKVAEQSQAVAVDAKQSIEESGQETAAWAGYYAVLAEGAHVAPAPAAPVPATPTSATPQPATQPIPLIRYTGEWAFPAMGMYHGAQPESIELVVNEENGHASGSLTARFKLPPGSTGDPVVKFTFTGEFSSARTQVFNLTTSEGAKGTLDLIPGPAFNLLEVNFQSEARPGKIRQGNVVLLKK
jgi:hypothetical protein